MMLDRVDYWISGIFSAIGGVITYMYGELDTVLICLFGCGGNRDKTKRPIMGEIAGKIADFCVVE